MNGLAGSSAEIETILAELPSLAAAADVVVCPPATLLGVFMDAYGGKGISFGAQDCHANESGAHTGDISAEMIADIGGDHVIVGHSERRADHGETDEIVAGKARAALRADITPIICVGETQAERDAGKTIDVIGTQLEGSVPNTDKTIVIAYEPVWAIGTGLTPTLEDIGEVHDFLRNQTSPSTRILYGGSVKPGNAKEILAVNNVNGALVGGASLKASDFLSIIGATA